MERQEQDREDLLKEATALVQRAELQLTGSDNSVVAGFRRDGAFSIFFGGDLAFHFNSQRQLRRAFARGKLYKAEQGHFIELRRERSQAETVLVSRLLNQEQEQAMLGETRRRLAELAAALEERTCSLIGQVPPEGDAAEAIRHWLSELPQTIAVANRPQL